MANIGELSVVINAKVDEFVNNMRSSESSVGKFTDKVKSSTLEVGKMSAAVTAAGAAIAAGIVVNSANGAKELANFSRVANSTTREFQALSFRAGEFGISSDKLAGQLQDVNDKIGDFIRTGGGEMADYFEQIAPRIGQTADQFAKLSGPQAMQLYVQSLKQANLSQAEMTFFMESMASDSTALINLFREQADVIEKAASEMEEMGILLTDIDISKLEAMRTSLSQAQVIVSKLADKFAVELSPFILQAADDFKILAKETNGFKGVVTNVTTAMILGFGTAIDAGNGLLWVYQGLKFSISAMGVAFLNTVQMMDDAVLKWGQASTSVINELIAGMNNIPGVEIEKLLIPKETAITRDLDNLTRSLVLSMIDAKEEIEAIEARPSALEQVELFLERVKQRSDAATTSLSNMNNQLMTINIGTGGNIDDLGFGGEAEAEESARQQRLEAERKFNEQMQSVRQHGLTGITDLIKSENGQQAGAYADSFASIISSSSKFSKEAFKINKTLAVANAIVKGKEAVVGAYAFGSNIGGPPLGAAMAAAAGAATLAQISSIQSQSFGGGGSTNSTGGGGSVPQAAPQVPQENRIVNVSLEGDVFGRQQVAALIGQINDALDDGYTLRI